jgi:DNA polymerase-3 subunit epsilon
MRKTTTNMSLLINNSNNLSFVNIETSGTCYEKDRIIGIGIIRIDKTGIREWEQIVNPTFRIKNSIEEITGISNKELQNSPTFGRIADDLIRLLHDSYFIAHNAKFEYGFLQSEFKRIHKLLAKS